MMEVPDSLRSCEVISWNSVEQVMRPWDGPLHMHRDEMAVALADFYQTSTKGNLTKILDLSSLDIRDNYLNVRKMGDKGAVALAILFASGKLSNLTTIDMSYNRIGDEGVVALAKSFELGQLSNLVALDLSSNAVGDEGVVALVKSFELGHLSKLTTLNLSRNDVADEGVVTLAKSFESGHLNNLTTLNLSTNDVADEGVVALAKSFESGHLSKLTTLNLARNYRVGDKGVVALAKSFEWGHLPNLTTLNLDRNYRVGDEGVVALATSFESGHLSNLTTLNLDRNYRVGDEGVMALAKSIESGHLNNLVTLDLPLNRAGDEGMVPLTKSFESGHLNNLRSLNLSRNDVADKGVVALAKLFESGHLSNLVTLDLSSNAVGDEGAVALAKLFESDHLSNLTTLNLSRNYVVDKGVVALAKSFELGHLNNLVALDLSSNAVGDKGVVALAKSFELGHLSNLVTLDLSWNKMGDEGVVALAKSFESGHLSNLTSLRLCFKYEKRDEGLVVLAKSFQLAHVSKLKNLKLDADVLDQRIIEGALDQGIIEFARTLEARKLPFLKELHFIDRTRNTLSRAAKLEVVRAYQNNTTLVALFLFNNSIVEDVERFRERNRRWVGTLMALQSEPNVPGTHGKVFLCGNPRVGKTTLRKTLGKTGWKFRLGMLGSSPRQEERTRGIEVSYIKSKNFSDKQSLTLAVWDMAGQEDYHVLHSAFLPDLALADGQATFFVIVCSASKDYCGGSSSIQLAEEELLYWLKFISSNSAKRVDKDLRRRVLIVLNCFQGDRSGHDQEQWKYFLADCSKKFAAFLTIHPDPFILNAKMPNEVKYLKSELKNQAKGKLRSRQMPQICRHVQETSKKWATNPRNSRYPVLTWSQYSSILFGNTILEEKLETATAYLHEAGHLIHFKEGALMDGGPRRETLVILDPEWFCQKVVGDLLLPEFMVGDGETHLRKLAADGSLPKDKLQQKLDIPDDKCEEVMAMLLRLGLCYHASSETNKIFVPALIDKDKDPRWDPIVPYNEITSKQACVMGFSLVLQDSSTTLIPMALFRKLQVELALDPEIEGREDCKYTSGKSRITFMSQGMNILVEFGADSGQGPRDRTTENRLDILVRPLVYDPDETIKAHGTLKKQQVKLAHNIVDRVLRISRDCCPGVELVRKIVRPWRADVVLPMMKRDVTVSVKNVMDRAKKDGLRTMNWTINVAGENVLVKEEELLCQDDLQELQLSMEDKSGCEMEGSELCAPPGVSDDSAKRAKVESQPNVMSLSTDDKISFSRLQRALDQILKAWGSYQSSERFSIEDKESGVPRFPSIKPKSGRTFTHMKYSLHFRCEAPSGDHEVDGQAGIDITRLKNWAKRLAPILACSLAIARVTANTASTFFLGVPLIPDIAIPPNLSSSQAQTRNAIADLLQYASTTLSSEHSQHERKRTEAECKATVKEVVDGMTSKEFDEKVGLVRVRILDAYDEYHRIAWVCRKCLEKCGSMAKRF